MKFILLLCAIAALACVNAQDAPFAPEFEKVAEAAPESAVDRAANVALKAQLGPAYVALVRALGTRTTAYVNNYARAAGLVATVKVIRQTFSILGSSEFVSFWRQYAALFGGAGGFQLNAIINAYGRANLSTTVQCISDIHTELGADALRLYQSILLATGGKASIRAARILSVFTTEAGDCVTAATTLTDLLSATGSVGTVDSQPRDLGVIVGVLSNKLGNDAIKFAARNPADVSALLLAARNKAVSGPFDFSVLTTYSAARVGQIIAETVVANSIDLTV